VKRGAIDPLLALLRGLGALAAVLACAGCFEYSPHAVPDEARHRDVHRRSLERLLAEPPPERLRFALLGDTQLGYSGTHGAVEALRRRDDIAFVVQLGDFTHLGLAREYELTNGMLARLPAPYFVVVGVHDFLSNGRKIYRSMFGELNFAFTWAGTRFVFLDTNSPEVGFDGTVPDLAWLAEQLAPAADHHRAFVFSHADPESHDFDQRMAQDYFALLRDSAVVASFHGHGHAYRTYEHFGVQYLVADDIDGRVYYVVSERSDGGLDVEEVKY
jgi:3',5'-cyclic AMP phosphodiesterase CpdA